MKLVGKGREIRYGVLIVELDSGHGSGFRSESTIFVV